MNRFPSYLRCGLLVLLASLAMTEQGLGWWKSDWAVRRKITIDTSPAGQSISEPIGAATVLLRLHDGTYQFPLGKEDGSDMRFVAEDDKTLLPYHVERFDSLLNEAFVWVRLPELKPASKTSFYLYYGNAGSSVARADDPKATFDAETVLVYHFGESGTPPADSSGKGNNGQSAGTAVAGSLIGGGTKFDGKNRVTIPPSASLAWGAGSPVTLSAWIKPGPPEAGEILFSRREEKKTFLVGLDNGVPFVDVSGQRSAAGAPIPPATWHQLAVVADGGKIVLYVDGDSAASLVAALPAFNSPSTLGNDSEDGAAGYVGELDEFEIAKSARPPGAIRFAVADQSGDTASKLLAFGEDEQTSNWFSGGTVGILMKSLTVDGWIIIGVLAVMGCMSWFVMVGKVRYLNAISGSNRRFLGEWRHLSSDLTVLDQGDPEHARTLGGRIAGPAIRKLRSSPLYVIYHVGVEEIRHRVGARPAGERQLSGLSMQAVRASMDGALVRETQKLGRLIVFLTLSISGGPFIGLLGTVIGVMITFASIAAAGDVNVNAIAPGIAAALVATVAGMAVAIPALFGYNYILSRVKDVTSDMHVFIDEFVTKAAEHYSPTAGSPRVRAASPGGKESTEKE